MSRVSAVRALFPWCLFAILVLPAPAQSPCVAQGLWVETSGGRLGDAFTITATGAPGASGLLGVDVGGGPVSTAIGQLCLGFSPLLFLLPLNLDASGVATFGGILPGDPAATGTTAFLQAAVGDPAWPGGVALSNGASTLLYPPRWYFLDPGGVTIGGSTSGRLIAFDALTETPGFVVPLSGPASSHVRLRQSRLIAVLLTSGSLAAYDEETGAQVYTAPLPPGPGSATKILPTEDGSGVIILFQGVPPTPFSPGTPGALVFLSLPSGGVFSTASLTSGNPSDIVLIPGTGFAYLRENTRLLPLDYINNVQLPSIELGNANGAVVDWVLEGNLLVTLLSGIAPTPFGGTTAPAAVHAADVTIHAAALPAPVPLPTFGGTLLRAGPGSAGPALFALLSSTGLIVELSPGTLAPVGTVTVPVNTSHLELSAGRMDWLIMQSGRNPTPFSPGAPGMLLRMDPATQAVSALSATPAERQQHLLPVASDSLRKAHIVSGTGDLFALSTDPAGLPGPAIPLPVSSQALSVTGNR